MPCGIRPSNVRVCHFTTRALAGSIMILTSGASFSSPRPQSLRGSAELRRRRQKNHAVELRLPGEVFLSCRVIDGLRSSLDYAAGRHPLTADGNSALVTRWDGETGRFVVRFDKSPGMSDLAYGFEAWSGPGAGGSWSGAWLEVLTDNEAVLEAADVSAPSEAPSRMIRLRVTRQ